MAVASSSVASKAPCGLIHGAPSSCLSLQALEAAAVPDALAAAGPRPLPLLFPLEKSYLALGPPFLAPGAPLGGVTRSANAWKSWGTFDKCRIPGLSPGEAWHGDRHPMTGNPGEQKVRNHCCGVLYSWVLDTPCRSHCFTSLCPVQMGQGLCLSLTWLISLPGHSVK